jgi:membrane-bound ClpP family serine protease
MLGLLPYSFVVLLLAACMITFKFVVKIQPDSSCVIVSLFAAFFLSWFIEPNIQISLSLLFIGIVVIIKILLKPDKGALSVTVWHFCVKLDAIRIHFQK